MKVLFRFKVSLVIIVITALFLGWFTTYHIEGVIWQALIMIFSAITLGAFLALWMLSPLIKQSKAKGKEEPNEG